MPPDPLAYRILQNNSKSVNKLGFTYAIQLIGYYHQSFPKCKVLGDSRKDVGEASAVSCPLEAHNLIGKIA